MKLVIVFYFIAFLISFYQFKKVENKIKSDQEFADLYKSIILFELKVDTFTKENKLKNFPIINKIISIFLKNMIVLQEVKSFKEVEYSKIKTPNTSNSEIEEEFLKELISSDESIKDLLCEMLRITDKILYNVDKKLYAISNIKVFYEMAKFIIKNIPFVEIMIKSLEEKREYFSAISKNKKLNSLMSEHC